MIAPKSFEHTHTYTHGYMHAHDSFRSFNIPFGQMVEKSPAAVYYYSSDRLRVFLSFFLYGFVLLLTHVRIYYLYIYILRGSVLLLSYSSIIGI